MYNKLHKPFSARKKIERLQNDGVVDIDKLPNDFKKKLGIPVTKMQANCADQRSPRKKHD